MARNRKDVKQPPAPLPRPPDDPDNDHRQPRPPVPALRPVQVLFLVFCCCALGLLINIVEEARTFAERGIAECHGKLIKLENERNEQRRLKKIYRKKLAELNEKHKALCGVKSTVFDHPLPSPTTANSTHLMMSGVDATEGPRIEDGGSFFRRTDGSIVGSLEIVKENGYEWVRIRLMVDPTGKFGLFQDLDYVLRMARQVKQCYNLKFLLDFHYSHWWADGDNQWTPDRWRIKDSGESLPMEILTTEVYEYTKRVMQVLLENGAYPDAVQVGNEISAGMLWDHGKIPSHWEDDNLPKEWINLVELIHSGIRAIEDVTKNSHDKKVKLPQIVIHLDTGGNIALTEKWMSTYKTLGGYFDVIGLSWYPMWHGTFDDLERNINNLSKVFPDKDVWVVETAYYYEGFCEPEDTACNQKFPFPMSEDGQYNFLKTLRETLLRTECRAVFYWGSHWSQPNKTWFRSSENWDDTRRRALFDSAGRALKGICALSGMC